VRSLDVVAGAALALPWIAVPAIGVWRASLSTSLDDEVGSTSGDQPLVSVIIPARDEARNIERCLQSVLATAHPRLEVIVVDDHSTDDTAAIVRARAREDRRVRLIAAPDLPPGWLGKPWACATGAREAHGDVFCFADADTVHAPDLLPRALQAMRSRDAEMLSIAGVQELGGFWELLLQPQVFAMLSLRYGGTEVVNRSPRVHDKIANGQCIVIMRDAYAAIGGHASVRGEVAEDMMLAQRVFAAGRRQAIVLGLKQLSTRMYTTLGEVVRGWRKNIFAGGANAVPDVAIMRWLFPFTLLLFPLLQLIPPLALAVAAVGAPWPQGRALAWATTATAASLVSWAVLYRHVGRSILYALAFPLGAAVLCWIIMSAIVRGRQVAWKGRDYRLTTGGRGSR
jgi:chlorobactene glucosyltransferase